MPYDVDLTIIGLGTAGIGAAELAGELGLRMMVVERHRPGGDCLWTGCVPSKSLIASARVAHRMATADRFGIASVEPEVDPAQIWKRLDAVREAIAATEDVPARFEALGAELVTGSARIAGPHEVVVDGTRRLSSRFILVATGSRPVEPPIPGLDSVTHLTSDDLWELDSLPESLVVIGGGPIALEMAQAMSRLGVRSTVLEMADRVLPNDQPEVVDRLVDLLRDEGIDIRTRARAERVEMIDGRPVVHAATDGGDEAFAAEKLLVAVGREPVLADLGLEDVGVQTAPGGIVVDDFMRTSIPTIYAAGDVTGGELFTHAAAYQGAIAARNMFLPGRGRAKATIPWVTLTDPELAHVGLTVEDARARYGDKVRVWSRELERSDRARTDGQTDGLVMLVTAGRKIVGGHFLGPRAGELANETLLAIDGGVSLTKFAVMVRAYPTYSTTLGLLAADAAKEQLRKLRWLVRGARRA